MKKLKYGKKQFIAIVMVFIMLAIGVGIFAANGDWLPDNKAKITSAAIVSRNTGTAPWDDEDIPGYDTSPSNNIVRSWDQVTWTVENTMAISNSTDQYYTGGKIYFEATIPSTLAGQAEWNKDSMLSWAEDVEVSSDGTTLTGYYTMTSDEVTVPGKQSLIFTLNVLGAKNGTEIQPTFKTWLNGNSNKNKVTTVDTNKVYVSAAPFYNVELVKTSIRNKSSMPDPNNSGETIDGTVYGYALVLSLNNGREDTDLGLKGTEFPTGDFDVSLFLGLNRWGSEDSEGVDWWDAEDITDEAQPLLYQYYTTGEENHPAFKDGRKEFPIYWGGTFTYPYCKRKGFEGTPEEVERAKQVSVYNSGRVSITQDGNHLNFKINDYEFDNVFPTKYNYQWPNESVTNWDGRGNFAVFPFQVIVPENEATKVPGTYYLTVHGDSMSATSISGQTVDHDTIDWDHYEVYDFLANNEAKMTLIHQIVDQEGDNMASWWGGGDAAGYRGEFVGLNADIILYPGNDPEEHKIEDQNILYKFDADCFEPYIDENGECYPYQYYAGGKQYWNEENDILGFGYDVYFAAKQDGTNWVSEKEQYKAVIEDLKYYSSLDELYADGNQYCVGVMLESFVGWTTAEEGQIWNVDMDTMIPMRVKETAEVGRTYSFTTDTRVYHEDLDRSVDSVMAEGFNGYSQPTMTNLKYGKYVKTEYTPNEGSIVEGTHNSVYTGNTLLVTDAIVATKVEIADKTIDNKEKTIYDFGKNEYNVNIKVTPSITPLPSLMGEKRTKLYVTAYIGENARYEYGSCNYGEPSQTFINDDGELVCEWEIENVLIGEEIEPLTFTAHLNEELKNGDQVEIRAYSTAPEVDLRNREVRTDETSLEIVNLASHRLYKITDTPVIEKNGLIHYTISYKNNTDNTISDFRLLDILPYNGDSRGSSFEGDYTLYYIQGAEYDADGNSVEGAQLFGAYTNDPNKRVNPNVKTETSAGWTEIQGNLLDVPATAIVVAGEVVPQGKITIDVYLKTNGNTGTDIYYNDVTAQVYTETEVMVTPTIRTTVVERSISGYIWLDSNKNGIYDEDESPIPGMALGLYLEDGTLAHDVDGNTVPYVTTDAQGFYQFSSLPESNYIVALDLENSPYKLTSKEVGYNDEINSKFKHDTYYITDVITRLSNTDLPVVEKNWQNAGLIIPEQFKITTEVVSGRGTISGEGEDPYESVYENENNLNDIVMTPATGYEIDKIWINGKEYIYDLDDEYKYDALTEIFAADFSRLKHFHNVTEDIHVQVSFKPQTKDVYIYKEWDDDEDAKGVRPDAVKFNVYYNGYLVGQLDIDNTDTFYVPRATIAPSNTWRIISPTTVVDENTGDLLDFSKFTLEEVEVNEGDLDNYETTIEYRYETADTPMSIIVTNTYIKANEKTNVEVTKHWIDDSNSYQSRPEKITFNIFADGNKLKSEQVNVTTDNEVVYTFTGLDKYNASGEEIVYTVTENDVAGYTTAVNGLEVTNTLITHKITTEVIGGHGTITGEDENPYEVVLDGKNSVKDIICNPDEGYTIKSVYLNGVEYSPYIDYEEYDKVMNWESPNDFQKFKNVTEDIHVQVEYEIDAYTVRMYKEWNDKNNKYGLRPDSIKINTKCDGQSIDEYVMDKSMILVPMALDDEDDEFSYGWYHVYYIPMIDDEGNLIDVQKLSFEELEVNSGDLAAYNSRIDSISYPEKPYSRIIVSLVNDLKQVNIVTRVEGGNGQILGEGEDPYETVDYSQNSIKDITCTPDEGYRISKITVNGVEVEFTPNADGTYTLPKFENMTEDKEVVVSYEHNATSIVVKHQTEDGEDLKDPETVDGVVGQEYTTSPEEFEDYELIKDDNGQDILPDNKDGNMTVDQIEVIYVYTKKKGSISILKVDKADESKKIEGAKFKIESLVDDTFEPIEIVTDENGVAKANNLSFGTYKVSEIEAAEGYELLAEAQVVKIEPTNSNVNILVKNKMRIVLPETGGDALFDSLAIFGFIVLTASLVIKSKKELANK